MAAIYLNAMQFKDLRAKLDKAVEDKNPDIMHFHMTSDFTGDVITKDVAVTFRYDSGAQKLFFDIGKRFSLGAKLASSDIIASHVAEVIMSLESPKPVEETPTETTTEVIPTEETK